MLRRSLREAEVRREVLQHAVVWGWHVPWSTRAESATRNPGELPGLALQARVPLGATVGWPDLTLVRRRDRRLVFAELTNEAGRVSARKRLVLDVLRSLEWHRHDDEQGRAERALGGPIPKVQVFVWRPSDLLSGSIDEVLR